MPSSSRRSGRARSIEKATEGDEIWLKFRLDDTPVRARMSALPSGVAEDEDIEVWGWLNTDGELTAEYIQRIRDDLPHPPAPAQAKYPVRQLCILVPSVALASYFLLQDLVQHDKDRYWPVLISAGLVATAGFQPVRSKRILQIWAAAVLAVMIPLTTAMVVQRPFNGGFGFTLGQVGEYVAMYLACATAACYGYTRVMRTRGGMFWGTLLSGCAVGGITGAGLFEDVTTGMSDLTTIAGVLLGVGIFSDRAKKRLAGGLMVASLTIFAGVQNAAIKQSNDGVSSETFLRLIMGLVIISAICWGLLASIAAVIRRTRGSRVQNRSAAA
jgi:hypothetical protein